jgi:tetratricopeptide (TPR) repeat protein
MTKPLYLQRFLAVVAGTVILVLLSLTGAFCQDTGTGEAGFHNQQGMEYFKKGFYDHAPKNQAGEAERNYGLAVKEFKSAIAGDFSNAEAHRNLARVYYVQKNFAGAAEEYQRVAELAPNDLDAYVNLALALIELKRPEEAIQALEDAKGQTSDSKALETLDSYIAKVRGYSGKEVR